MIQEKYAFELDVASLLALLCYEYSSVEAVIHEDILNQVKPEGLTKEEFIEALREKSQELWEEE